RNELLDSIDQTLKAPNKTEALENYEMGYSLAQKGKFTLAIDFFKKSIQLNPLHYRSYVQLALTYMLLKDYENALIYARESVDFAPEDNNELLAYSHYLVSLSLYSLGENEEAYKE